MESLKELYRIGPGPSSSHTLAIKRICEYFLNEFPDSNNCIVDLYGSLSLTGKGHMTDKIIYETLGKDTIINFLNEEHNHPNTIVITFNNKSLTFYSTGGGAFEVEGKAKEEIQEVYKENTMEEIIKVLKEKNYSLYDYVIDNDIGIKEHLINVWKQMKETINSGLNKEGYLPGELKLERVAKELYKKALSLEDNKTKDDLLVTAYAYSCAEENASGNTVTTAPTLGSCGVLPAVLYHYYNLGYPEEKIIEALGVGGIYGNLIKKNASISGAKGGCQAEIGTACAMAASSLAYLEGLSLNQISYAAEIGIEHHLGLTCDPIGGYVQIPCIERNGVAALRAIDASNYAKYLGDIRSNRISFDTIVETMNYTGERIARELKETSLGGLAKIYKQ